MDQHVVSPDGRKLAYKLFGEGHLTVVFESGLMDDSSTWEKVQRSVSRNYRTLSYDRAGLGESCYNPIDKTVNSIQSDLFYLLETLQIKPPIVLVGHSFGGFLIKYYSQCLSADSIGLVFVDGSDSEFEEESYKYRDKAQCEYWEQFATRNNPLWSLIEKQEYAAFYDSLVLNKKWMFNPSLPTAILVCDQITSWFTPDNTDSFRPDLAPKIILEKDNLSWINCHAKWLKEIPNARFKIVKDSTHYIHHDYLDIVIQEIEHIAKQVETHL